MSSSEDRDIEPFDWFNRFFGGSRRSGRGGGGFFGLPDIFRGFDEMRGEMEREFEDTFKNIESKAPKDLVREYETPSGDKVREYGPFVYGYSMTIGPDGKPKVREFGNVKSPLSGRGTGFFTRPLISSEREPLADVTTTSNEVKVVVEMPGLSKENIKVNIYDNSVEVTTTDTKIAVSLQAAIQAAIALVISVSIADSNKAEQVIQELLQSSKSVQVNHQQTYIQNSRKVRVTTTDTDLVLNIQLLLQLLIALVVSVDIL
jgi:HSP20 family protein